MANHIAIKLDRHKTAEVFCAAGVGGEVRPLRHTAESWRPVIALKSWPLQCATPILKCHRLQVNQHYDLGKMAVEQEQHEDFAPQETTQSHRQIRDHMALLPQRKAKISRHAFVLDNLRGRNVASNVARATLAEVRQHHWNVIPRCSRVAGFIRRYLAYADLPEPELLP
jgi:uncharacterized metal-binding protein